MPRRTFTVPRSGPICGTWHPATSCLPFWVDLLAEVFLVFVINDQDLDHYVLEGPQRWSLPDLNQWELQTVTDDSALILKMLGLFDRAVEVAQPHEERAFLMEHPADPQDYLGDDASMTPSVWEWEEIREFARRHQLNVVKFDQGRTGHSRRKPTTLMTSLHALNELDGLSGGGT